MAQTAAPHTPIEILKSLDSNALIKGVRVAGKGTLFGTRWAREQGEEDTIFIGTIDRWHTIGSIVYVRWEGWAQCKQARLDSLVKDDAGGEVGLRLLD